MVELYERKLAPGGQIVTDRLGLCWVPEVTHPRWSFDFDDLAAVAAAAGLTAFQRTASVYVLSRSAPLEPTIFSRSRNLVRRVVALPGRIVRNGPARLSREYRKWVGTTGSADG